MIFFLCDPIIVVCTYNIVKYLVERGTDVNK